MTLERFETERRKVSRVAARLLIVVYSTTLWCCYEGCYVRVNLFRNYDYGRSKITLVAVAVVWIECRFWFSVIAAGGGRSQTRALLVSATPYVAGLALYVLGIDLWQLIGEYLRLNAPGTQS